MSVQWTEKAAQDLNYIEEYIRKDNPQAAITTILKIINSAATQLSKHPAIGRPGHHPQTRELIIADTPYIIPYQIIGETVYLLRVIHSSMQWPNDKEMLPTNS
ncbi:MAG: type II toxin-antitoxin system RelE/ParE family toxin [Proteobacteria bacterium]|nr:type II toxin-antitoxin system RelE/ParE family toxin [Pseudomonadota bacterium]